MKKPCPYCQRRKSPFFRKLVNSIFQRPKEERFTNKSRLVGYTLRHSDVTLFSLIAQTLNEPRRDIAAVKVNLQFGLNFLVLKKCLNEIIIGFKDIFAHSRIICSLILDQLGLRETINTELFWSTRQQRLTTANLAKQCTLCGHLLGVGLTLGEFEVSRQILSRELLEQHSCQLGDILLRSDDMDILRTHTREVDIFGSIPILGL